MASWPVFAAAVERSCLAGPTRSGCSAGSRGSAQRHTFLHRSFPLTASAVSVVSVAGCDGNGPDGNQTLSGTSSTADARPVVNGSSIEERSHWPSAAASRLWPSSAKQGSAASKLIFLTPEQTAVRGWGGGGLRPHLRRCFRLRFRTSSAFRPPRLPGCQYSQFAFLV